MQANQNAVLADMCSVCSLQMPHTTKRLNYRQLSVYMLNGIQQKKVPNSGIPIKLLADKLKSSPDVLYQGHPFHGKFICPQINQNLYSLLHKMAHTSPRVFLEGAQEQGPGARQATTTNSTYIRHQTEIQPGL